MKGVIEDLERKLATLNKQIDDISSIDDIRNAFHDEALQEDQRRTVEQTIQGRLEEYRAEIDTLVVDIRGLAEQRLRLDSEYATALKEFRSAVEALQAIIKDIFAGDEEYNQYLLYDVEHASGLVLRTSFERRITTLGAFEFRRRSRMKRILKSQELKICTGVAARMANIDDSLESARSFDLKALEDRYRGLMIRAGCEQRDYDPEGDQRFTSLPREIRSYLESCLHAEIEAADRGRRCMHNGIPAGARGATEREKYIESIYYRITRA